MNTKSLFTFMVRKTRFCLSNTGSTFHLRSSLRTSKRLQRWLLRQLVDFIFIIRLAPAHIRLLWTQSLFGLFSFTYSILVPKYSKIGE